jgi:hypothetical protein
MGGFYLRGGIVVAVNVLPKEGNFFDSLFFQLFYFREYRLYVATAFSAPNKRYDTEGTHIVASPHYGYESSNGVAVCADRSYIGIGLLRTKLHVHLEGMLFVNEGEETW